MEELLNRYEQRKSIQNQCTLFIVDNYIEKLERKLKELLQIDKSMPDYKGMCERQEEQIAKLKCVCEVQKKKLCYYERKTK